jgi:hypothetical protein
MGSESRSRRADRIIAALASRQLGTVARWQLLDAAFLLDDEDLEQLVGEVHFRRLASEAELRDQLARNAGKRGNARLRAVLGLSGGPQRIRSPGERWMLRLLREARIAGFKMNAEIHGERP